MAEEQPKRTTDERIDAIAMNLELLSHQVQDIGHQVQDLGQQVQNLGRQVENLTTTMTKNFQLVLDSINALRVIAAAH